MSETIRFQFLSEQYRREEPRVVYPEAPTGVVVYVTRDLLTVLLDHAAAREPTAVSVQLTATPAGEFDADLGLAPETPVVTHFTLPEVGGSVNEVFGVELGTPAGTGRARFVSHPDGDPELTKADDLAGIVLVAVPPWDHDDVVAYDRAGARLDRTVVDASPPEESVPE